MDTYNTLPEELYETLSSQEGGKAEEEGLDKEWGELIDLYQEVDRRNDEFRRFFTSQWDVKEDESLGDC